MNVQYRLDKVAGLRKKQALSVVYENCHIINRYERTLNNVSHPIFFKRRQSDYEASCAPDASRVYSVWTYFFNEYLSAEELADECIKDDKVLCENIELANDFKNCFLKSIKDCYGTELHFVAKKKKSKIKNQPTLFE